MPDAVKEAKRVYHRLQIFVDKLYFNYNQLVNKKNNTMKNSKGKSAFPLCDNWTCFERWIVGKQFQKS